MNFNLDDYNTFSLESILNINKDDRDESTIIEDFDNDTKESIMNLISMENFILGFESEDSSFIGREDLFNPVLRVGLLEGLENVFNSIILAIQRLMQNVSAFVSNIIIFFSKINMESRIAEVKTEWKHQYSAYWKSPLIPLKEKEIIKGKKFPNPKVLDAISDYINKEYKPKKNIFSVFSSSQQTVNAIIPEKDFGKIKAMIFNELRSTALSPNETFEKMYSKLSMQSLNSYTNTLKELVSDGKKIIDNAKREKMSANNISDIDRRKLRIKFNKVYANLNDASIVTVKATHIYVKIVNGLHKILKDMERQLKNIK